MNRQDNTASVGKRALTVREMLYASAGAALIAVCAWITVPGPVPFTMQTFAVFMALALLGGKVGTLSIVVYLMIGLFGVPVFAGFAGGPGVLFGPTGGYLLGFLLTGLIYYLMTLRKPDSLLWSGLSLILGHLVCYTAGTAWFLAVSSAGGKDVALWTALGWCVFPFLLPDLLKLLLALGLVKLLRKRIGPVR